MPAVADDVRAEPRPGRLSRAADDARVALAFLTVLPFAPRRHAPGALSRAAAWFPLVGALVGGLTGGLRAGLAAAVGGAAAAVIAVIALVVLTGALHQDGLADCADALGARGGRGRRLEVMRDPRIGVFGALAIGTWLLLAVAALAPLSQVDGVRSLVAGAVAGRAAAVAHARALPPARKDGLGAAFAPGRGAVAAATALTAISLLALCGPGPGAAALAAAAAAGAGATVWAARTLGGRSGDTLGAAVALTEAAVWLTLVGFWRLHGG